MYDRPGQGPSDQQILRRQIARRTARRTRAAGGFVFAIAAGVVVLSAIFVKEAQVNGSWVPALTRIAHVAGATEPITERAPEIAAALDSIEPEPVQIEELPETTASEIRWFDGRPVRPARRIWMTVTGYSPDARSCGKFADGQTATLHSVWTNGMRLVAADTDLLPFGTMLTVPGYADGEIVPVLDRGGAIKGTRLDLLYPTHAQARKWGVQRLAVVVWEYADGEPAPNPRKVR